MGLQNGESARDRKRWSELGEVPTEGDGCRGGEKVSDTGEDLGDINEKDMKIKADLRGDGQRKKRIVRVKV